MLLSRNRVAVVKAITWAALLLGLPACSSSDTDPAAAGGHGTTGGTGGAGTAGSAGAVDSGGSGGATPNPPPGNAVVLDDGGTVMPIYPVTAADASIRALGFTRTGPNGVTARDEHGQPLWQSMAPSGSLFGGFDFDADGYPDAGVVRSEDTGVPCGASTIVTTSIELIAGQTGEVLPLTAPLDAICWTFPSTTYPTHQWTGLEVLFGTEAGVLAAAPYYATDGSFWRYENGALNSAGAYLYPSTDAYGITYANAQPNAFGTGPAHTTYPHVQNGLITTVNGQLATVFFTSARVLAMAVGPTTSTQLLWDSPYLTGNRTDIVGRNYGIVAIDPAAPNTLVLVAGTGADTLASDMLSGTLAADPWAAIERHVSVIDITSGAVDDRFYSYAHDNNDGHQYEGRIVFANSPFVRRAQGPSRLAYNVYEGGRWNLHITAPASTQDALVLLDQFLWDIRDLDGDGTDEWLLSPSKDPEEPDVPGYYFAKWRTILAHWDEDQLAIVPLHTYDGVIPYLHPTFRLAEHTSSRGYLYPALTMREADRSLSLLLRSPDGSLSRQSLPPLARRGAAGRR